MPANYVLLEKITVGVGGATSVTFSGIPQTGYTDLVVKISGRTNRNYGEDQFIVRYNSDSTGNYAYKFLQGYDGTVGFNLDSGTNNNILGMISSATSTANSFGNAELYIANYTSSAYKSITVDSVAGTAASPTGMRITSSVWTNTAAIISIFLDAANGTDWLENSTFYLYGVAKLGTTPAIVPYATGGDTIMTDGTYWYHAFKASGIFTPAKGLSCDVLVVAGGGSGGADVSGGGGAGGVIAFASQSLANGTGYTATVGAGGAGLLTKRQTGNNGVNSSFGALTAAVGGGPGSAIETADGGSGGGKRTATGGAPTSGQGNYGGGGTQSAPHYPAGGGGGAGGVGGTGVLGTAGAGGAGTNSVTNWGALSSALTATGLGVSGYIAGGGGGGSYTTGGTAGSGGATAGGANATSSSATVNTGSGSGGAPDAIYGTGNGGSGLVIVRYAV